MSSPTSPRLDALERQVVTLTARMDAFSARRSPGPRDRYDYALIHVLAHVSVELPFTVAAMWRRRAVDQALADALLNCDIDNPKQLGKLMKRLVGHDVGGAVIQRVGTTRDGAMWRVCVSG